MVSVFFGRLLVVRNSFANNFSVKRNYLPRREAEIEKSEVIVNINPTQFVSNQSFSWIGYKWTHIWKQFFVIPSEQRKKCQLQCLTSSLFHCLRRIQLYGSVTLYLWRTVTIVKVKHDTTCYFITSQERNFIYSFKEISWEYSMVRKFSNWVHREEEHLSFHFR